MVVQIESVKTRKQLKKFIYLPEKLHKNHANWLPPIYMDEWKFYNPRKNHAMAHCDTTLALAYKNGELVGRIMGIIHYAFNETWNQKDGRFFNLDCINDQEVANALIKYIEDWARSKGMDHVVGPYGFSDKDPQGAMVEGFDKLPVISAVCNFDYIPELIQNAGYKPYITWVEYKFPVPDKLPDLYYRVYDRLMRQGKFQIKEFTSKRELRPYIIPVFRLINEAFTPLYGFAKMSEAEMKALARQYWPVLDPRFVKLVFQENEVVGVIIGIPNLTEGIRKARGRLFPFGIFTIKKYMKQTRQLDLIIGAIKEDLRGRGIDVLLGKHILESAQKAGFLWVDSHLELETNVKIRAEMERMGGKIEKWFRTFRKAIQ